MKYLPLDVKQQSIKQSTIDLEKYKYLVHCFLHVYSLSIYSTIYLFLTMLSNNNKCFTKYQYQVDALSDHFVDLQLASSARSQNVGNLIKS